jgi:oligopeptide transport system substrate-binding protein
MIMVNNTIPPMDDIKVRKAFVMAIDQERIINDVFEGQGIEAFSILPPAMPGFSAELKGYGYDPEQARALLEASDYTGELPEVVMNLPGSAGMESDYTLALLDMWRENLGVEVTLQYFEPATWVKEAAENPGALTQFGWCADYPDPENFLDLLFHSGNNMNLSNYSNPEVDSLLEAARTELDPAGRLRLYNQAERMLLEDAAAILLGYAVNSVVVNPRVGGYVSTPMSVAFLHLLELLPYDD